jgi:hypothetical protein
LVRNSKEGSLLILSKVTNEAAPTEIVLNSSIYPYSLLGKSLVLTFQHLQRIVVEELN